MSEGQRESGSRQSGRWRHLGQLGLVFKHRHGTWADFGRFLEHLFSERPSEGGGVVPPRVVLQCRHNTGSQYEVLKSCSERPQKYPMFAHERYSRPCISIGTFEPKKNPGLVNADVCRKAQEFLIGIGKGDPAEATGRDFCYDPTLF